MANLLPLGFGGSGVIPLRLLASTRFMGRPHILKIVGPTELKGANMFDDPALTHAVNAPATHHAVATRSLLGLEPTPG
ncbi:hypothetical protein MKK58_00060 [Methylobacterium sp. J-078]|nr:hypothetical protein [Methylobacterium sp. J-078]MCJ2042959.1 hypothetical protein [Methylobacterium sp. J-078]